MAQAFNPSTPEVDAGGVQGQKSGRERDPVLTNSPM